MTIQEKLKSNVIQIQVICDYLAKECEHDSHLAERVLLESKTLDKMYQFILTAVKNRFSKQIVNNGVMVKDDDVFNLAIHYFIENDEDLNKEYPNQVTKAEVKANTEPEKVVETTPNEEAGVKYEKWFEKAKANNFRPDNKPKKADEQLSLFDFDNEEEPEEDEENEYDGDEE